MQPSPAADTVRLPLTRRLARLMTWFGSSRRWWALGIATAAVAALTEPLLAAMLKPLFDRGFTRGQLALWIVPVAIILLFLVRGVAQFISQYALARIANEGMQGLRRMLFQRLLEAELALFSRQSASTLSNTVVYEVQTGAMLLVQALLSLSRDGFVTVALLFYLVYLNWKLTLIVGVMVPGVAWIMKVLSKRLYHLTRLGQHATDELAYVVEENVLAHKMVRLHRAEASQSERFERLSHSLNRLAVKSTIAQAAMTPLTQLFAAFALSIVVMIALWQAGEKGLTVGGFIRPPGPDASPLSHAEYDAATWSDLPSLATGRKGNTATLLADGTVLVVGGSTTLNGDPTAAAEVFDPAARTWRAVAPTIRAAWPVRRRHRWASLQVVLSRVSRQPAHAGRPYP